MPASRRNLVGWTFVLPALTVFTGLVIVPIAWSLSLSFLRWNGLGKGVFIGFQNYVVMFQDAIFVQSFFHSLIFALAGSLVQLAAGMTMAVVLLSLPAFRNLMRAAYFIPCIISSVAISQIFAQLLALEPEGLVNGVLRVAGLAAWRGPFLADPDLTLAIVTLVDAYKFCAIYMAIYYAALASLDREIVEAAEMDGASWWQTLVLIRIPMIRATVAATVVLVVSGTLKGFDISFVLTNGGPGAASELVSTYLYKTLFNASKFGYGSAIAVFLAIECLLAVAVIRLALRTDEDRVQ